MSKVNRVKDLQLNLDLESIKKGNNDIEINNKINNYKDLIEECNSDLRSED